MTCKWRSILNWGSFILLLLILLGIGYSCRHIIRKQVSARLDAKAGTLSIKETNQPLSVVLDRLEKQTGLRIFVSEMEDRTISIDVKDQPIEKALAQLLGPETRYTLTFDKGELNIGGSQGDKKGRKQITKKPDQKKMDIQELERREAKIPLRNVKPHPEKIKEIQSNGIDRGTKQLPEKSIKQPLSEDPKKPREKVAPIKEKYARLRLKMEDGRISLEHVSAVPGKFIQTATPTGDYVYTVKLNDKIMAIGSFEDPLVQYSHYPDPERTHEVLKVKTGYFNVSFPGDLLTIEKLRSLSVEVFKVDGTIPSMLTPENFRKSIKSLRSVSVIKGETIEKYLKSL